MAKRETEREREKAQQATCADAEATADTAVRWLDCLSDDDTLSYTRTHTNTHTHIVALIHIVAHTHTYTGRPAAALGAIIKVSPRTQPPHSGCNGFLPSLSLSLLCSGPRGQFNCQLKSAVLARRSGRGRCLPTDLVDYAVARLTEPKPEIAKQV